jgi:catechol 2,3-dioxygenase-like lactoylglutathione lyase family enzyme
MLNLELYQNIFGEKMIIRLDHFVLTVKNIDRTMAFYTSILGMKEQTYGNNRKALKFGNQKINLHEENQKIKPYAHVPTIGSADICLITETPIETFIDHLNQKNIHIIEGPVNRAGAISELISVYFRDPDNNLIEVSNILEDKNNDAVVKQ